MAKLAVDINEITTEVDILEAQKKSGMDASKRQKKELEELSQELLRLGEENEQSKLRIHTLDYENSILRENAGLSTLLTEKIKEKNYELALLTKLLSKLEETALRNQESVEKELKKINDYIADVSLDQRILREKQGIVKKVIFWVSNARYIYPALRLKLSGQFDVKWYLTTHKDIANTGINPVLHYVKHGEKEGRMMNSKETKSLRIKS